MASQEPPLNVICSPGAISDLRNIWRWTAEHFGAPQADSYLQFLRSNIAGLGRSYARGKAVPGRDDLRHIIAWRKPRKHGHVIVYSFDGKDVYVVHIFHTAQDWPSKLIDEP